jgi:hypothetical protein
MGTQTHGRERSWARSWPRRTMSRKRPFSMPLCSFRHNRVPFTLPFFWICGELSCNLSVATQPVSRPYRHTELKMKARRSLATTQKNCQLENVERCSYVKLLDTPTRTQVPVPGAVFLYAVVLWVCNKAISVRGREGPYGSETLRVQHYLDNRLIDGGKVVTLTRRPRFTPQENY